MRRFKVISLVLLILIGLCGCGSNTPSSTPITDEMNALPLQAVLDTYGIDFADRNTELHLSRADRDYFFKNKYKNTVQTIIDLIGKSRGVPCSAYEQEENDLYLSIRSTDWEYLSIRVNSQDQVEINYATNVYHCEGIYEALLTYVDPLLSETATYYRITSDTYPYQYVIYDKSGTALASETTTEIPHTFQSDDGIIHHWQQTGTGTLSRWAVFYDWDSGRKSPQYGGHTDHVGRLVSTTAHGAVHVWDMFSGELLHTVSTFRQPLGDCVENIVNAYFCDGGGRIKVTYLNTEFKEVEQVFELPETLLNR